MPETADSLACPFIESDTVLELEFKVRLWDGKTIKLGCYKASETDLEELKKGNWIQHFQNISNEELFEAIQISSVKK